MTYAKFKMTDNVCQCSVNIWAVFNGILNDWKPITPGRQHYSRDSELLDCQIYTEYTAAVEVCKSQSGEMENIS